MMQIGPGGISYGSPLTL